MVLSSVIHRPGAALMVYGACALAGACLIKKI